MKINFKLSYYGLPYAQYLKYKNLHLHIEWVVLLISVYVVSRLILLLQKSIEIEYNYDSVNITFLYRE
jgi:hypothetical protein